MGHSLYELDLELFEDVDSQVGNSFVISGQRCEYDIR